MSKSRVRLLVNDTRPAAGGKGRIFYSPGFNVVDDELALEWLLAGKAIAQDAGGAVHAPAGRVTCAVHGSGRSCVLVAEHAGDHFDLAVGFWPDGQRHVAEETPAAPSTAKCPTIGCTVGVLGHPGECNAGRSRHFETTATNVSLCPTKGCTVGPLAHPGPCNAGRYAVVRDRAPAPAPSSSDEVPEEKPRARAKGRS